MTGKEFDGNVNKPFVEEADDQAGLAGHGGMHGISGEQVADNGVFTVRRRTADLVARVEIAQDNRDALRFEISLDPLAGYMEPT